jgi:hypothetical protein
MYWFDELLQTIVDETNTYAKTVIRPRRKEPPDSEFHVEEDEDVDIDIVSDVDIGKVDTSNDYYVYGMGGGGGGGGVFRAMCRGSRGPS